MTYTTSNIPARYSKRLGDILEGPIGRIVDDPDRGIAITIKARD